MQERRYAPLRAFGEAAAVTIGLAVGSVAIITARNHRELTHRSITLHPLLQILSDAEQRTYGVGEPKVWAAVHRIHHSVPDASLFPFYTIARAIQWVEHNPDKVHGISIPDTFAQLDPYVDRFSRDDVMTIGTQADALIKKRMGDTYQPPADYTQQDLAAIFYPTEPKYTYPTKKHEGAYSQDDIARLLLTDPHSPVLIPPPEMNKTRGILKRNVPLYSQPANLFREHPELEEADLQNADGKNRRSTKKDIALGILVPSAAVFLRRHRFGAKDVAIALAVGSAIYGAKIGLVVAGGNIVNSLGHAGELTQAELVRAVKSREYMPHPNEDGTVSTDTTESGLLGRLLSVATLDEVGGQEEHHNSPDKIAYTSKEGLAGALEAPWGEFLEKLAYSRFFPFITVGPGFDLQAGETRPDQPLPAMAIIHARRAEQLRREKM